MTEQQTLFDTETAAERHKRIVDELPQPDRYVYQQLCRYETTLEDELDELERLHTRGGKLSPQDASDAFWRLHNAGLIEIDKGRERGMIRRIHHASD